ncbi:MAG TPA: O-antigen ligase family protein [Hyphomonas sp.]|nr:O-antigen ligase family protein [Hyphomonas sp.]
MLRRFTDFAAAPDGRGLALAGGLVAVLAMLVGGYTGKWPVRDAMLVLPAVLLLVMIGARHLRRVDPITQPALLLAGLFISVPLLQSIPLPPAVWTFLPGHAPIEAVYQATGIDLPWFPVSVVPLATLQSGAAMALPLAFFLLGLLLPIGGAVHFVRIASLGLGLNLFVGALQVLFPGADGLRVLALDGNAVTGLFENPNHFGFSCALLVMLLPTVMGRFGTAAQDSAARLARQLVIAIVVLILIVIGISSQSRAAIILSLMALAFLALESRHLFETRRAGLVFVLLSLGIGSLYFAAEITGVLEDSFVKSDSRSDIWRSSVDLALTHLPLGAGVGTFELAYLPHEPVATTSPFIINEAHNLYLQILVEWGLAGLALLALGGVGLWRAYGQGFHAASGVGSGAGRPATGGRQTDAQKLADHRQLLRCGAAALVLTLVHGFVDYPERTMALSALLSFLLGYAFNAVPLPEARPSKAQPRSTVWNQNQRSRVRRAPSERPPPGPGTAPGSRPTMRPM